MGNKKRKAFPPEALSFLAKLRRHNNRAWFQARQQLYEQAVKAPMTELVLEIAQAFRRFAPEMVADPRVSLYRIYRDTRFSKDKSPYKTHAAAVFPVRGLPKNEGPGLYFHVSPEEVLIGGGMYMPDPALLRAVREEIAASPEEFFSIVKAKRFRQVFGEIEGDQLKTTPKGFSAEHPAADYLRYKQFLFAKTFPPSLATSARLLPTVLDCFEKGMPLIRFFGRAALRNQGCSPSLVDLPRNKWIPLEHFHSRCRVREMSFRGPNPFPARGICFFLQDNVAEKQIPRCARNDTLLYLRYTIMLKMP